MSNQSVSIYAEALKRQQEEAAQPRAEQSASDATRDLTQTATRSREGSRAQPRERAREVSRETKRPPSQGASRGLPSRDEIQEFSFRLRDELRVKVQAEVPPHWQGELKEIARELNVRKLELYRFIIGEFLGKVRRKRTT